MLFILFWVLTMQFTWQSMGQSQASWFLSQNILNCVAKTIEAFTGLERQHFHFGVEYPFKCFKVSHKRVFTVSGRLRGTVH